MAMDRRLVPVLAGFWAASSLLSGCGGGDEDVQCYAQGAGSESAWLGSLEDGYCQDTFLGLTTPSFCTSQSPCHDPSEFGTIACSTSVNVSTVSNESRWYLSGSVNDTCCGFWASESVLFRPRNSSVGWVPRSAGACGACASTDNTYLLKKAVPYWCQSSAAKRDDPGRYAIVCDRPDAEVCAASGDASAKVTEELLLNSSIVAELEPGTFVDVLEVKVLRAEGRVRGRVANPPGWISLRVTDSVSLVDGCHAGVGEERCTWALRQMDESDSAGGSLAAGTEVV